MAAEIATVRPPADTVRFDGHLERPLDRE